MASAASTPSASTPLVVTPTDPVPLVVTPTDPVTTTVDLSLMPKAIENKVKESCLEMQIAGEGVQVQLRVTFGEYGPSAEIEESKLEELALHATTSFESTYEISKRERDVLNAKALAPGFTSEQKTRLKQLNDHVYALENFSTFAFTSKYGKPFLELKARTSDKKPLNISIELDPECSGFLAAVQNQIDRYQQKLTRLQIRADSGTLTEGRERAEYEFLKENKEIWSNPNNFKIEIGTHPDSGATIPYFILCHPDTDAEIVRKPVETADERLIQRVKGKTSKIQDVFQLLHARFKEAINDPDSDFAEKSGYNQYIADRTGRVRGSGTTPEEMRKMMERMRAAST